MVHPLALSGDWFSIQFNSIQSNPLHCTIFTSTHILTSPSIHIHIPYIHTYIHTDKSPLNWKKVEAKKNAVVHRIDKCEYYNNEKNPVVRFRCSLEGPCIGMKMVDYIMKIEERSKWDPQIEALADIYVANDLEEVDRYMNGSEDADGNHVDFSSSVNDSIDTDTCIDTCSEKGERKYGHCGMFGIGYTKTKRYLVVDGREQLTLCGLQEFPNGSALIWGVEMEERHNDLFPPGERRTRAKTRLYTTAIVPTSSNTFDAEYCLQLDPGGALPSFLTTPIMIDSVKTMFTVAKKDFGNEVLMKDWMSEHLLKNDDGSNAYDEDGDDSDEREMIKESVGLIMTP